ncbi:MAG: DUF429 domain-containing protein [Methylococcales bacterium]
MLSILAIDAAWTENEPTGVALLKEDKGLWICAALAPSYNDFYNLAKGIPVNWEAKPQGELPNIELLLKCGESLLGTDSISLITVDMPVSTIPITGRREAENAISRQFGAKGCSTHTPNTLRPGKIGATYSKECFKKGYELGVLNTKPGMVKHLLEVYPHPALLELMDADYRLPYKASKAAKFWPNATIEERKIKLLKIYTEILTVLKMKIDGITLTLPDDLIEKPFSAFKRFEDSLDALICGWVGMKYLAGEAEPYGDSTGAIWIPC